MKIFEKMSKNVFESIRVKFQENFCEIKKNNNFIKMVIKYVGKETILKKKIFDKFRNFLINSARMSILFLEIL